MNIFFSQTAPRRGQNARSPLSPDHDFKFGPTLWGEHRQELLFFPGFRLLCEVKNEDIGSHKPPDVNTHRVNTLARPRATFYQSLKGKHRNRLRRANATLGSAGKAVVYGVPGRGSPIMLVHGNQKVESEPELG